MGRSREWLDPWHFTDLRWRTLYERLTWHLLCSPVHQELLQYGTDRGQPPSPALCMEKDSSCRTKNLVSLILCWETQSCAQAASALMKAQFHLRYLPLGRVSGEDEILRGLTYETEDFYDVKVMLRASKNGLSSILLNRFLALKLGTISGDVQQARSAVFSRHKEKDWLLIYISWATGLQIQEGLLRLTLSPGQKEENKCRGSIPSLKKSTHALGKGWSRNPPPLPILVFKLFFFIIWTY